MGNEPKLLLLHGGGMLMGGLCAQSLWEIEIVWATCEIGLRPGNRERDQRGLTKP